MKMSGGSDATNRVKLELESGAVLSIVDNRDGTVSISETTYRLLNVQPEARNMVTLSTPMPAGVSG